MDIFDMLFGKERYKANVHQLSVILDLYNGATKKLALRKNERDL